MALDVYFTKKKKNNASLPTAYCISIRISMGTWHMQTYPICSLFFIVSNNQNPSPASGPCYMCMCQDKKQPSVDFSDKALTLVQSHPCWSTVKFVQHVHFLMVHMHRDLFPFQLDVTLDSHLPFNETHHSKTTAINAS